jgi:hypothetical protein
MTTEILKQLVEREDRDGAFDNVAAAAAAIINDAATRDLGRRSHVMITIAPAIADKVAAVLRARYPRRMILDKRIVESCSRTPRPPRTTTTTKDAIALSRVPPSVWCSYESRQHGTRKSIAEHPGDVPARCGGTPRPDK